MFPRRRIIGMGLAALCVTAVALCPVTTAALLVNSPAAAFQPFGTVPPVSLSIPTPIGTTAPVPTPIPTLGPGQAFDETSRPETITTLGDDQFGYGEVEGQPGLYLIWITDKSGTHYFTVEGNDSSFRGDARDDDFVDLIRARTDKLDQVRSVQDEIDSNQAQRATFDGAAGVLVGLGVLVCGFISGGTCFIPFAVGGLAAVGQAASKNAAAQSMLPTLEELQGELGQIDQNLQGRFGAISP